MIPLIRTHLCGSLSRSKILPVDLFVARSGYAKEQKKRYSFSLSVCLYTIYFRKISNSIYIVHLFTTCFDST